MTFWKRDNYKGQKEISFARSKGWVQGLSIKWQQKEILEADEALYLDFSGIYTTVCIFITQRRIA